MSYKFVVNDGVHVYYFIRIATNEIRVVSTVVLVDNQVWDFIIYHKELLWSELLWNPNREFLQKKFQFQK